MIKRITVPIYDLDLYLVIGSAAQTNIDMESLNPVFGQFTGSDRWLGLSRDAGNGNFMLGVRTPTTMNTVVHEVFHVTHRMMDYIGDKFTRKGHEPYAYLAGWITDQVWPLVKKRLK